MTEYEYSYLVGKDKAPGVHQQQDSVFGELENLGPFQTYYNPLTGEIRGQDLKFIHEIPYEWQFIPGFSAPFWDLSSVIFGNPIVSFGLGLGSGLTHKANIDKRYTEMGNEGLQLSQTGQIISSGMPHLSGGGGGGGGGEGDEEEFGHLPYQLSVNYNFEGIGNSYNIDANESNFGILYDRARGGGRMPSGDRPTYPVERIVQTNDKDGTALEAHGDVYLSLGKGSSVVTRPKNPQ